MNDRLSEIEERLRAFNVTGRSEEDDPVPHWKASDEFHGNSAPDIQWLLNEVERRDAEIARLRAAGRALAPHVVEADSFMDTLYCGACRVTMSDDEEFEHAADCPVLVFEAKEGGE